MFRFLILLNPDANALIGKGNRKEQSNNQGDDKEIANTTKKRDITNFKLSRYKASRHAKQSHFLPQE